MDNTKIIAPSSPLSLDELKKVIEGNILESTKECVKSINDILIRKFRQNSAGLVVISKASFHLPEHPEDACRVLDTVIKSFNRKGWYIQTSDVDGTFIFSQKEN